MAVREVERPGGDSSADRAAAEERSRLYRGWEDVYRFKWTWDGVYWGTHCVDCYPGNCPFRVYVKDGMVWREEQAGTFQTIEEGVPDWNPMGCQKGAAWSQQLYSPDRLAYPLKRVGARGEGKWKRITWDEATTEIADAIIDAILEEGPESIVQEGTPEVQTIVPTSRFMGVIGGTTLDLQGSFNDFSMGLHITFGKFCPVSSADDWFHSELILIWHMNPIYTRIPFYHFIAEARYRGAEVITIAPDVSPSTVHADYYVPINFATDAAFALSMVQVILSEGIEDRQFISEQTDLPFLVRRDNGRYLRQADLEGKGRSDQLYFWDRKTGKPTPADRGHLKLPPDAEPALEGTYQVTLHDQTTVSVSPVLQILRERLDEDYTPEKQQSITGIHPDIVRMIARKAAKKKTNIMLGWNSCKYYHGDLMERSMCLFLAVTGNWGKKGTGIRSWSGGMFDGLILTMSKARPGVAATENVLQGIEMAVQMAKQQDPSRTYEIAIKEMALMRIAGQIRQTAAGEPGAPIGGARMSPPFLWWYYHAGYAERWNKKEWNDPSMKRSFQEYLDEALSKGWFAGVPYLPPNKRPLVLIECGGNMLRRTRGGQTALLKNLWDKFKLIVSIDFRLNITGLHSDIVLPAAQHYEKLGFHIPTPHVMNLTFSDRAARPYGEAKPEFEIYALILKKIEQRAKERGLESYKDAQGFERRFDELWMAYTANGYFLDEDRLYDEMVRDSVLAGTLPEGTTLQTLREKGFVRFIDLGFTPMAVAQASPIFPDQTHVPFRNHVEKGDPYPTYARRAQFYIDHPWFLEAGEELPVHKDNPKAGGNYPLRMTSGHNRWSIHAMNMSNWVMLQTHRGEPHVSISVKDAEERGVQDGDFIEVYNDVSSFVARARVSPLVRPGQIISYNGWDGFMYPGWRGANETEAGMVKWLLMAGGYGHLNYTPVEWQPVPADRAVPVDFRKTMKMPEPTRR